MRCRARPGARLPGALIASGAGLLGALVASVGYGAPPPVLRLGLPAEQIGGRYAGALSRLVLAPFTRATGQAVLIVRVPAGPVLHPAWDLAQLDPVPLAAACAAGVVRPIDWAGLGGRARMLPFAASDCGVGAFIRATVLIWDGARLHDPPDWAALWNVARLPGRRGLKRSPVGTLEIALLADGVPPRDVYPVLRGREGQDRAFRKLDQLRPYIAWWTTDAEPLAMLRAGKVLMTAAPSERLATGSRTPPTTGVQWAGALVSVQSWAIGAGSRNAAAAAALMRRANDAAVQPALLAGSGLGSAQADSTTAPGGPLSAHRATEVPFDAGFWRDDGPALTARFNAWLAH